VGNIRFFDQKEIAMGTKNSANDLEEQAVGALCALLGEVSVVKLKEVRREARHSSGDIGLVAYVDVLGHSHTLACRIAQPEGIRSALRRLSDGAAKMDDGATPVIIAPYMSPEAQALCKESHAGFIDLEGNARIALGEVFIGKRSMGTCAPHPSAASLLKALELKVKAAKKATNKAAELPPIAIPG
jgi:hypothetical protein